MKRSFNLSSVFGLTGQVAVVTGDNGQLGTEYAGALIGAGARVAVLDMAEKPNKTLAVFIKKGRLLYLQIDIRDKSALKNALRVIEKKWTVPTILVSNAGIDSPPGANADENESLEKYSLETWNKV